MDVHLENKGSGIEVGKKLRRSGNKTPIVFATGNSYSNTLEQVKDIEDSLVISKPVDFEQLLSVIRSIYEK